MARPRSTDPLIRVKGRLADGSAVTYYYDRATRAPLGTDEAIALDRANPPPPATAAPDSLGATITEYLASPEFRRKLKPGTQVMYRRYLTDLRLRFGDFPCRSITPGMVQELKDSLQDQPRKANHTIGLLRLVLNHTKRRGRIGSNPADKPGKVAVSARTEIWSVEEEDRVLASLRPSLKLALLLMLYTLQRQSDVLAMTKSQVRKRDGRLWIVLRQAKTDELIEVPVHRRLELPLRARLKAKEPESLLLVPSPTGKSWTRRNFSRAWDHDLALANAKLVEELQAQGMGADAIAAELDQRHRQRRDFRRTGVVRLANANVSVPKIAAIAGWRIDYAQEIVNTYLPRRSEEALAGIEAWEQAEKAPAARRVVRISDFRKPK